MKIKFLIRVMVLFLIALNSNAADNGLVLKETIWATNSIPVCWEIFSDSTVVQLGWVQSAVVRTWEASSSVRFVGWSECTAQSKGVRIAVRDEGPYVVALGSSLDGLANGMVLNFTYNNWGSGCVGNEQYCSDVIAVHEFGHALGFAHEQNRFDTPATCTADPQGTSGDTMIGAWDLDSVMNYCNPKWNGNGNLSATDSEMVKLFYTKDKPEVLQECNWFGTLTPLCSVSVLSGWGWQNEKSCVSISACSAQPSPYGIVGGTSSSSISSLRSSSSSSLRSSSSSSSSLSSGMSVSSGFSRVSSVASSAVSSSRATNSSSSSRLAVGVCKYSISSEWDTGFSATIRITNNGAASTNDWSVSWAYSDGTLITDSWGARLTATNPYTANNFPWNSIIQSGQFIEIGFNAKKGTSTVPEIPLLAGSACH
jgi:hypothetical protein